MTEHDVHYLVHSLVSSGATKVRGFRTLDSLAKDFAIAVREGKTVVFEPSLQHTRHFFNASGFISAMHSLVDNLPPIDEIIPAGAYGSRLVFAFRSRSTSSANSECDDRALSDDSFDHEKGS